MRRYGCCASNPKGTPEDATRCVVEVSPTWNMSEGMFACMNSEHKWEHRQCPHARGKGPDGLYCGVHASQIARGLMMSVPDQPEKETT